MPRFRFTAADSSGAAHDGTIDAATEADARNKLASNGLAVRSVEAAPAGGVEAPELPRRPSPRRPAAEAPDRPPVARPAAVPEFGAGPRRGGRLPLVLSALALLVALGTAGYVALRDPLGGRLSRYDFSTPEAAHTSRVRMEANADFPAMIELQQKLHGAKLLERVGTVGYPKKRQLRDKTVPFVEWTEDGSRRREVAIYEKDPDTGIWKQSFNGLTEIQGFDQRLAKEIAEWTASHPFIPGGGNGE